MNVKKLVKHGNTILDIIRIVIENVDIQLKEKLQTQ